MRVTGRSYKECFGLVVALILSGCDTPTEFSDTRVETFVAQTGLPNVTGPFYFTRLGSYDLQVFSIGFGEIIECPVLLRVSVPPEPAECRRGLAMGLRLSDRVGWVALEEEGITLPDNANRFDITGGDDPVLNGGLWDLLKERDAQFYTVYFKGRISRDPDTPLAALHRIADELPEWMWPRGGHLLLDNSIAVADRDLVVKLASLPVFQGDPYAEVRTRAQALLQ